MRQELIGRGVQVLEKMELKTGLEPATFSLVSCGRLSIGQLPRLQRTAAAILPRIAASRKRYRRFSEGVRWWMMKSATMDQGETPFNSLSPDSSPSALAKKDPFLLS